MDIESTLKKILEQYVKEYKTNEKIKAINRKIEKGIFRYSEAETLAMESGQILNRAFAKYLPEALTNGKLYRETAETVLKNPMLQSSRDVRYTTSRIQKGINEAAGIGMNPIEPEINMDQINGIITGICNAESFDAGKEILFDQVENFLEGTVDDYVHANADFQYQAGLDPIVIRTAAGKCCKWCSNLAGTYKYEAVRDNGNDVWRRHRNCHCIIEYDPGKKGGKRERVSGPSSTDQGKADRIAVAEAQDDTITHIKVSNSELPNGLPIRGKPNSIVDKTDDFGNVLQRRKHGKNGLAAVDYDLSDHGEKNKHPTGAHKHIFDYSKGGKPRRIEADMTEADLVENADIIIKGVNYHEQK